MIEKWLMDAINKEVNKTIPSATAYMRENFNIISDDFKESMKAIEAFQEQLAKNPIGIKANQEWFDKQVKDDVIIIDNGFVGTNKQTALFTGLPFTIDNTVDTYEFIYREEE
ncbi:hypothetical protein [Priestia megaterium]|uniref:hypothetical protein n=1 Tax=Priestia megaterium TaxID=1404 RepID=UPI00287733C3|nr:hypothetical protein [Priestia megaterium]